jgi:hypothetical protein
LAGAVGQLNLASERRYSEGGEPAEEVGPKRLLE